jgi:hypothetical protein
VTSAAAANLAMARPREGIDDAAGATLDGVAVPVLR